MQKYENWGHKWQEFEGVAGVSTVVGKNNACV